MAREARVGARLIEQARLMSPRRHILIFCRRATCPPAPPMFILLIRYTLAERRLSAMRRAILLPLTVARRLLAIITHADARCHAPTPGFTSLR